MENYLFEKMPVPKAYMKLALPVVLSMIVSLVYNMIDTYFIALTGVQELGAGVSLVAPMFTLMIAFGDIFGLGGSSVISRLLGEKKDNEAKKTCAFCIWVSLVFGLCISVILLLFRTQILGLLGVSKVTYEYANAYYTWIAIGAVSIIFSMVPSNILRTEGLAVQSMAGSIIGSIVNIIFDPIFIFGLNQGAAGAAMATVLGNIIADIYYVYAVIKKSKRLTCSPSHMKITGRRVKDILMIGIPASITNIMQTFMMVMTNNFLLPYGTDKVAAMGIALKVNMITALVLVGFAFGGLLENSDIYPGGLHGDNVSLWIRSQIGVPGLILVLLATAILFGVALTRQTMGGVRKALHPQKGNNAAMAEEVTPQPEPTYRKPVVDEPETTVAEDESDKKEKKERRREKKKRKKKK